MGRRGGWGRRLPFLVMKSEKNLLEEGNSPSRGPVAGLLYVVGKDTPYPPGLDLELSVLLTLPGPPGESRGGDSDEGGGGDGGGKEAVFTRNEIRGGSAYLTRNTHSIDPNQGGMFKGL